MLKRFNLLVSLCFKRSQSQRIISGLKKTFVKRYIVERTNKGEIRPQEQSEKAESCRENSWTEIQLKGYKDRNRHKNRIKRIGQVRLVYVKNINRNIPTTRREPYGDKKKTTEKRRKQQKATQSGSRPKCGIIHGLNFHRTAGTHVCTGGSGTDAVGDRGDEIDVRLTRGTEEPVSYTHLTLPTIRRV